MIINQLGKFRKKKLSILEKVRIFAKINVAKIGLMLHLGRMKMKVLIF